MTGKVETTMNQCMLVKKKRGRPRRLVIDSSERKPMIPVLPKASSEILVFSQLPITPTNPSLASNQNRTQKSKKKIILPKRKDTFEKREVDQLSKKQNQQLRDKDAHNAEEKRRKGRINYWIYKLGDLLFKMGAEKQSKRAILEKAFDYISDKETHSISDSKNVEVLLLRIKDLETTTLLLLELLQKHSVCVPEHVNITKSSITNMHSVNKTSSSVIPRQVPLEMQMVLPTLATTSETANDICDDAPFKTNVTKDDLNKQSIIMPINKVLLPPSTQSASLCSSIPNVESTATIIYADNNTPTVTPSIDSEKAVLSLESIVAQNKYVSSQQNTLNLKENLPVKRGSNVTNANTTKNKTTTSSDSQIKSALWRPDPSSINGSSIVPMTTSNEVNEVHFIRIGTTSPQQNETKNENELSVLISSVCTGHSGTNTLNYHKAQNQVDNIITATSSLQTLILPTTTDTSSILTSTIPTVNLSTTISTSSSAKEPVCTLSSKQIKLAKIPEKKKSKQNLRAFLTKKTMTRSMRGIVKSPIQGFGIENILVTNSLTSSSKCQTTTSVTFSQTNEVTINSSATSSSARSIVSKASRPRLPSSGHTVAALLEPSNGNNISKSEQDNTVSNSDATNKCDSTTVSCSEKTSKRWGNVVEKAHNSNMYLTSFVLVNKGNNNKSNRKTNKRTNQNTLRSTLDSETSDDKSGNPNKIPVTVAAVPIFSQVPSSTLSNMQELVHSNIVVSTSSSSAPLRSLSNTVENHFVTLDVKNENQHTKYTDDFKKKQKTKPNLNIHCVKQKSTKPVSSQQSLNCFVPQTTASVSLINSTAVSSVAKTKSSIVRTMKDRTVKNKWLVTDKNDNINPAISISVSDNVNEQCASPVISYPNIGKRKRKTSFHVPQGNSSKRHATDTNQKKVTQGSSRNFSAESLCRSSNFNHGGNTKSSNKKIENKKEVPSFAVTKPKNLASTSISVHRDIQRLQHQPDISSSNSLPTILNIFAPAPVPTTATQQQTFQSAFSNFSAETLVGSECNIGVMDTNNLTDTNFTDSMLMAANPQLFTNFSADTLISGNDSSMPFAVNNLIGQNTNNWNQPNWLPQDMNEAMFQSMGNLQNNNLRQRQNIQNASATECSPIKSIMSILNSAPNNNTNFHFDNFADNSHAIPNVFSNHQNRLSMRDNRNIPNSGGELMTNIPNMWMNRPPNTQTLKNFVTNNMGIPSWNNNYNGNQHNLHNPHNPLNLQNNQQNAHINSHGNSNNNQLNNPHINAQNNNSKVFNKHQLTSNHNSIVIPTQMNSGKLVAKTGKEKSGPTFGNYSLVNSGTPT